MVNTVLVAGVIACLLFVTGCGGGSDGTSSGESSASSTTASPTTTTSADNGSKSSADKNAEPSAEFVGKGENGKLAKAGKEASVADREAASKVLEESFEAREAKAWAAQCGTLTAKAVKTVEEEAAKEGKAKGCASSLESIGKTAPQSILENPMTEPIAALRINGGEAFAFFHGTGGKDYVIPMEKENGEWKVSGLAPQGAP